MKINKKWIKRGLACIGVVGVGKIDMDAAYKIGESGWLGGTQDALDTIPRGKEFIFTEEMRNDILDKLDETIKLTIKDDCVIRHFPDGFTLGTF